MAPPWTAKRFREIKAEIESFLDYKFNRNDLLLVALCTNEGDGADDTQAQNNEALERRKALAWIGDAALDLALGIESYHQGWHARMTDVARRNKLRNTNLRDVGSPLLREYVEKQSAKVLGTALEAIFAAMYLDSGMSLDVVKIAMRKHGLMQAENE